MIKTIWLSLSTPFITVFTGKYKGYPVSRNPFSWVGMLLWGLVLIPFTLFIYPVVIGLTVVGFHFTGKNGLSAEFVNNKIEISSKTKGIELDETPNIHA